MEIVVVPQKPLVHVLVLAGLDDGVEVGSTKVVVGGWDDQVMAQAEAASKMDP